MTEMKGPCYITAAELEGKISVRVVNVSTIKSLQEDIVKEMTKGCKAVVTAEEHTVKGGMGSAVAEILCKEKIPIEFIGIQDTFGRSAHSYKELLEYYGLTTEHVKDAIETMYAMEVE